MALIVKIISNGSIYEIHCNDWRGPAVAPGEELTTIELTQISRCCLLPKQFPAPVTISFNGKTVKVQEMYTMRQTVNRVVLKWKELPLHMQ
ncbi:MAG: hypothetical protein NC086_11795 [Alistipes sp.]|nr:hypothetical protein [Alistipes sp.]